MTFFSNLTTKLALIAILFVFPNSIILAQEDATTGVSFFTVTYIKNNKHIGVKDLQKEKGNAAIMFWSSSKLKRIRLYNNDTLSTEYRNSNDTIKYIKYKNDPYYYSKYNNISDSSSYIKTESNLLVNSVFCDVYRDTVKNITAYLIKDKPINLNNNSNYRDLIRLKYEYKDYSVVLDKTKQEYNIDTLNVFSINKDFIITPIKFLSNKDTLIKQITSASNLFYNKSKFPGYFYFKNLEGVVRLSFVLNSEGKPVMPLIRPKYYRYYTSDKNITNAKKVKRITRIIEKKIIKNYNTTIANKTFEVPITNGNKTNILVTIPLRYLYYSE